MTIVYSNNNKYGNQRWGNQNPYPYLKLVGTIFVLIVCDNYRNTSVENIVFSAGKFEWNIEIRGHTKKNDKTKKKTKRLVMRKDWRY